MESSKNFKKLIDIYSCINSYSYSSCLQKCHISLLFNTEFLTIFYLGILFFANPEIVAKANIPKRAIPKNKPAP